MTDTRTYGFLSIRFRFLLATFLCLLVYNNCCAQNQPENNPVILEHADSLVGKQVDGEKARELFGHVQFRQGKTVVTCDRALQYLVTNKISMEGTVQVHDDSMRMVGKRGMYYSDTRIAEAFDRVQIEESSTFIRADYGKYFTAEKKAYFKGNVYVEDTSSVVTSDELTYYRSDQHSIATGNVKIVNSHNGLTIFGDHFENFKQKQYSKITGKPKVIQIDTAGTGKRDTLVVTSVFMESFQDSTERLIATDSVRITRGGLAAESGSSVFFTKLDSIVLRKSPIVWYSQAVHDENQVSGDSIFLKLKNRKLETAFVEGRGIAISRADSNYPNRFNQMTGQEIILHFVESKITQIDVNTTATSLYFLFDQGKANGMNKTSGDNITMTFLEGKIDKISVVTGVEGQFYPERLVKNHESAYNLDGFNFREDMPGKKKN